jgi:hypothetical protein
MKRAFYIVAISLITSMIVVMFSTCEQRKNINNIYGELENKGCLSSKKDVINILTYKDQMGIMIKIETVLVLFLFPLLIGFGIYNYVKKSKLSDSKSFEAVQCILIVLILPYLIIVLMSSDSNILANRDKYIQNNYIADEMEKLVNINYRNDSTIKIKRPLIVLDNINHIPISNKETTTYGDTNLYKNWLKYYYNKEEYSNYFLGTSKLLERPPEYSINGYLVINYGMEYSGKYIQLDAGEVPEVLNFVTFVYLSDKGRKKIYPNKIYGGNAKAPSKTPGVHYYSKITGPEVKKSEIENEIDKILNE